MASPRGGAWRIGQLGAHLGVSAKTIRYYDRIDLLPARRRTLAGYRIYDINDRDRLGFILKAKAIGLSLEEIRGILGLRQDGREPCEHVLGLVDRKLELVDEELHALDLYRRRLVELRAEAGGTRRTRACVCGIIESHPLGPEDRSYGSRRRIRPSNQPGSGRGA